MDREYGTGWKSENFGQWTPEQIKQIEAQNKCASKANFIGAQKVKYKSDYCQKCGAHIGWVGRFLSWVFPFDVFHKCCVGGLDPKAIKKYAYDAKL